MKNKAAVELGRKGGQKTASLHGKKHFSAAGKKGMEKRWKKQRTATVLPEP
jgi:general stress protein YciG